MSNSKNLPFTRQDHEHMADPNIPTYNQIRVCETKSSSTVKAYLARQQVANAWLMCGQ